MTHRLRFAATLAGLSMAWSPIHAAFPTVALKPVVLQQIHSPTTITYAPDGSGRLFVCDQLGKIYIIQGGMLLPTPFLNIANPGNSAGNTGPGPVVSVGTGYSERGLLGLAFHPGFANSLSPGYRKFYVNYLKTYVAGVDPAPPQAGDPTSGGVTVVSEFTVSATNPNLADAGSERRVLAFTQPQDNHNGGMVEFGPDGMLYIGTGDGGSSQDNAAGHTGGSGSKPPNGLGNGLDRTNYLGKILRIDPLDPDGAGPMAYTIPADNPFFSDPTPNLKKEIYAFGLRNPWRFSFDKRAGGTNRLFCGDVGQGRIEEVNLIVAGGNYGWRYKEGHESPSFSSGHATNPMPDPLLGPYLAPIASYAHPNVTTSAPVLPQLGLSVTGGFVYRGSAIPALQGKYVFGDYGSTNTLASWNSPLMGLEETAPLSGTFTLTQAIPLLGQANPIVGQRILCLGEDESGEIYIGMKTNAGVLQLDGGLPAGGIYKIVPVQSSNATLQASQDNTIFSEDIPKAQFYSDGLGYVYAGRTGPNFGPYIRRGLVAFDVGSIPSGAVIQSVQVKLNLNQIGPAGGVIPLSLHRLNETWGEGTSQNASGGYGAPATPNDATWTNRFHPSQPWSTAGGAFQATASATVNAEYGIMTWGSTAQLVSDVQGWVDTPATNAGWMIRGDEATDKTACRFDSGELGFVIPSLELGYQHGPLPTHFETWIASYFPTNLMGQFVDPNGDIDGDGIKNQIEYSSGLSPVSYDATDDFSVATAPAAGSTTDLIITFRRDTEATDLTYLLQISSDLINWTTIAQSVAGAAASGENGGVVESDDPFAWPVNLVTVRKNLAAGSNIRQFVRLKVDRY